MERDIYHISNNLESYEHGRTGFFEFIVHDIDSLVKSDFSLEEPSSSDVYTKGQDVIRLSVVSASVPHFSVDVIPTRRGNSIVNFAGVPSFKDGNIVCEDYVGLGTKSILMAWQALVYDVVNDKGGRAKDYKKNCELIEYTQDYEKIRSWDLIGCFIVDLSEEDFDKSGDGERRIQAAIKYDRAIMHQDDATITQTYR